MIDAHRHAKRIFEEEIPFNRVLGLEVTELSAERARLRFPMQESLVGNFVHQSLHGGVISAVIDATGGLVAYASQFRTEEQNSEQATPVDLLGKTGTLDLRIDYLVPGKGSRFDVTGTVLRRGRRFLVARMDLSNETQTTIATGTGV